MQNTRPAEFIGLVAALTAMVAMTIDTMLPAVGVMAKELGAAHDNDRHLIILMFFAGLGLGTLIFGVLSDSTGRKPAILLGLGFYLAGSLLCFFSTSFPMLIAGRVIQGFGAASPRVVSLAMVRDGAKGAEMARIMSYVMSVFMLVPIIAPSIGQLVLTFGHWRLIFLGFMVMAILRACGWCCANQKPSPLTNASRSVQPPFGTAPRKWCGIPFRLAIPLQSASSLAPSISTLPPRSRCLPSNTIRVVISHFGLRSLPLALPWRWSSMAAR